MRARHVAPHRSLAAARPREKPPCGPPRPAAPRAARPDRHQMFARRDRLIGSLRLGRSRRSVVRTLARHATLPPCLASCRQWAAATRSDTMDLMCSERVSESGEGVGAAAGGRAAAPDPVLLRRRVLDNLLRTEERYASHANYFGTVQREVTPHMRRLVAEWMLEVCEDQSCQEEVFPLAMAYLDRFLATCSISKNQLQLLGTTCLLLASKLREPSERGLPADLLVYYTDNSITLRDLYSWELLVLSKLKWDMACVTPHDFLPLLLARLPAQPVHSDMLQRHAQTFIALAARDYKFSMYSASTLAAASLAAALRGVQLSGHLHLLHQLTGVDQDCLQTCLEQVEAMVQQTIEERSLGSAADEAWRASPPGTPVTAPAPVSKAPATAATPTDVRDVHF